MATEMTPQERAAADDMYNRLISVMHNARYADQAKERLALFYRVTRRAALLEAVQEVDLVDTDTTLMDFDVTIACRRIREQLTRLAQEG